MGTALQESRRKQWRRLLVGVVSISFVLSGALYDASKSAANNDGSVRRERVTFEPGEAGASTGNAAATVTVTKP